MTSARDIDLTAYEAILFDLDGVLTATARVHSACWKRMFDEFLRARAEADGTPFVPFDRGADYLCYVDGKPRMEGVKSFLESRGIRLPFGDPDGPPERRTVCGLGNRKNALFREVLAAEGADVFESSVTLARRLRQAGKKLAVVSSSKNCMAILEVAKIRDLFDYFMDGNEAQRLHLAGKPHPDTFLTAAGMLGVAPERAVVVEDAISGVQAGRAGGFGLVVGVARHGDAQSLLDNGADVAVADLAEFL
jgi:alpha,alpha-trehalase